MEKENLDNGIKPDVNESLALAGLFRKVSVKERLPKKNDIYFIIHNGENISTSSFYTMGSEWLTHGMTIEYWLEEIELPSEEEIESKGDEYGVRHGWRSESYDSSNDVGIAFERGAIWVRSLAVTAKDNVR